MMTSQFLQTLTCCSLVLISQYFVVDGFQIPSSYSDVALHSNISATHTCQNGWSPAGAECNFTCPTRTSFPRVEVPLGSISSSCNKITRDATLPNHVNQSNGVVEFNDQSFQCNSIQKSDTEDNDFTLTMWIKSNCTDCLIFDIGTELKLMRKSGALFFHNYQGASMSTDAWHFVAVRRVSSLSWHVNATKQNGEIQWTDRSVNIHLGPNTNLTSGQFVRIADVGFYHYALTDREIQFLYSGTFESLPLGSDCRCPSSHPTLVKNTFPVDGMLCTDGNNNDVSRFNPLARYPEFLNDNDPSTSWNSGNILLVNVTISLKRTFQLHKLTMYGVIREANELKLVLYKEGMQRNVILIRQDCSSIKNCITYSQNGFEFSYVFDSLLSNSSSTVTRDIYEKFVANKLVIVIKPKDFFISSGIHLYARCDCYGNDQSCQITRDEYSCKCDSSSNTQGVHCDTCKGAYYRKQTNLNCNIPCNCNVNGSVTTSTCAEDDGQCQCKSTVEGRKCDTCKHNHADFSSAGCRACSCNATGIVTCMNGDICKCKNNVETKTGKCRECLPNFYGIKNSTGCSPCNCFQTGTVGSALDECDQVTGQCQCKTLVEGRQCEKCKRENYGLSESNAITGCRRCDCNFVGSQDRDCQPLTGECTCKMRREPGISQRNCEPTKLHLDPTFGPVTGGTVLTITGHDLGADVSVAFNIDKVPQNVTKRNETHIFIVTQPSAVEGKKSIRLYWANTDGTEHSPTLNEEVQFEYRPDPSIAAASVMPRESYASGGCSLMFDGSNLNSVAHSKLLVYHSTDSTDVIETSCTGEPGVLTCFTPNLTQYDSGTNFSYGFYLDGINKYNKISSMVILDDPEIETGQEEDFRTLFDDVFRVKGKNLNLACHDADVSIMFDDKVCRLMSRTGDSISCDPEEGFPGSTRTVTVKVKIGNWEEVWGRLNIKSFWSTNEFIYIVVGVALAVILISVVVGFFVVRRYRSKKAKQTDFSGLVESREKHSNSYEENPIATVMPMTAQPLEVVKERTSTEIIEDFCSRLEDKNKKVVKASTVDRSHIEIGKLCTHKGNLIRVVNGVYNLSTSSPDSGSSLTIKTLIHPYPEEGDLPDWLNKGLAECTRLQDFTHENVLRMMGIAIDVKSVYILYPEMSKRTLKDYLTSAKEPVSDDMKMCICLQIAMGMNYLSSDGITHKDLAARNCWVTADDVIKVGDASFSHDLYPDEYLDNGGRYQPIRWMAPESLQQGFYDTKSDVWSLGVVLWEVYENGSLPYYNIKTNMQVKDRVTRDHYRLGKPHNCSDKMFGIIEQCHSDMAEDRPNFFVLVNMIEALINPTPSSPIGYVNDASEDVIYTNMMVDHSKPPVAPKAYRR